MLDKLRLTDTCRFLPGSEKNIVVASHVCRGICAATLARRYAVFSSFENCILYTHWTAVLYIPRLRESVKRENAFSLN